MAKTAYIQRYLLIIRKIKNHPFISLNELIKEIENEISFLDFSDNVGLSKRTIQRDFKDILEIFKIDILYSKLNDGYYIEENENSNLERQLEYYDMVETFDMSLDNCIFFEKRKSRGTEYLQPLLMAIKKSQIVEFRYRKFDNTVTKEIRTVEPYALKEFKNRWYLLAVEEGGRLEERGHIKTWGLDRIENFQPTSRFFNKNESLNVEDEFKNAFGIFSNEEKEVEEVILSFSPLIGKYNASLPLHSSQETLIDNDKEFRIKLNVKITEDFINELLSQSEDLQVISPIHLRDKLIEIHQKAIELLKS